MTKIWIASILDNGPGCYPVHPEALVAPTHDEVVSKLIAGCKESWDFFNEGEEWPYKTPLEAEYGVDALQAYCDVTESHFMVLAIDLDTMKQDTSEVNRSNRPGLVLA